MGYNRALSAIYLEESDRIAQIEYIMHTEIITKLYGHYPFHAPQKALAETYRKLDIDMIFWTFQSWHPWNEAQKLGEFFDERTDWSILFPTTWRSTVSVSSIEEVLNFDPTIHVDLGTEQFDKVVVHFEKEHKKTQSLFMEQLVPGGSQCTCFMWPVMAFGLEWTLRAAYKKPKRFERLLNKFAEISLRDFRAWAECDIKVFISHDDICMTEGPMLSPDWLRRYVFPWYKRLWNELKSKGIKVLFCSDGNITRIVDDIVEAGADGFIMEPSCDLGNIAEKYGDNKILMGNVDLKSLTFGDEKAIQEEVLRCLNTAGYFPGYFINVTGSIPDNVPLRNLEYYFKIFNKYGRRSLIPKEVS
jgi:hypothetical protein